MSIRAELMTVLHNCEVHARSVHRLAWHITAGQFDPGERRDLIERLANSKSHMDDAHAQMMELISTL